MENVKAYRDIRLCFNRKTFLKHSRKPNFSRAVIYNTDTNFGGVELKPTHVVLNKPRCKYIHTESKLFSTFFILDVGVSVLALAKWIMYDFHYETIMKIFGEDSVKLLFTDTDSLW